MNYARAGGWTAWHFHDSRRFIPGRGFVGDTDAVGFPDTVIAGFGKVYFWELKKEDGIVSPEQEAAIALLVACGQNARIVRPSEWYSVVVPALERRPEWPKSEQEAR